MWQKNRKIFGGNFFVFLRIWGGGQRELHRKPAKREHWGLNTVVAKVMTTEKTLKGGGLLWGRWEGLGDEISTVGSGLFSPHLAVTYVSTALTSNGTDV